MIEHSDERRDRSERGKSGSGFFNYLFKEQRLLFILVGILIGSTSFNLQPTLSRLSPSEPSSTMVPRTISTIDRVSTRFSIVLAKVRRVPIGISRWRSRIVVTNGAGFIGSHLVILYLGSSSLYFSSF